ncbi:MAG: hypothetical protein WC454_10335 [Phycisphaerae bacterium]|jgi:hypothetical protein
MKRLIVLFGCVFLLLGGCQEPGRTKSGVTVVIIDGNEPFPQALAGRWKDSEKGWEFVFEPDGTISSAVIDSNFMAVEPAKRVAQKPMLVGKSVYKLGQWTVQYTPKTRELGVEVVVDFFHVDFGKTWLEGSSTDWFVGTVSEDYQTWQAEWVSFPEYIAYTPEPGELPVDPNDTIKELLFKKVTDGTD